MLRQALATACLAYGALFLQGCGSEHKPPSDAMTCSGTTTAMDVADGLNLTGKVAVITGGDGGLGLPVVRALAKQGAAVIIASRNHSKTKAVARKVSLETGNSVRAMHLDLSSLASVRAFVERLLKETSRLDILINNAGIDNNPQKKSKDGFQLLFAVNYLGPFLLTDLLLPLLRKSGSDQAPARIVNMGSSEHSIACDAAGWKRGCLADWTYFPPPVVKDKNVTITYDDGLQVNRSVELYGFTKLLTMEHARALALREGNNVHAFSLTPGWVNDSLGVFPGISPVAVREKCRLQRPDPCPYTPEEGAAVTAFCALRSKGSGGYFSRIKGCREDVVVGNGFSEGMRKELYERSLGLVARAEAGDVVVV